MGGSNSTEETPPNYDSKIFGPNGKLMEVTELLKIQENLKDKYPKLSNVSEKEKKVLMPKLRKVYELIDNWRSDVDLQYRQLKAAGKIVEDNAKVPEQILGFLVSLLVVLSGLQSAWSAVEIANLLKKSTMEQNDMAAFAGKAYDAAKYVSIISSQLTESCKQTTTFEGFLLKASQNMRTLLCNPTEEQWKSLRQLSSLEIDDNLYLYEEIRKAMEQHTRPFVYEYVFATKLKSIAKEINQSRPSSIFLTHMNIGDEDVPWIIQQAFRNKKCTHLHLSGNNLTGEGVRLLCEELRMNTTAFTHLALATNRKIADEGAKHVANLLSKNRTLTGLNMHNTGISDRGVQFLCAALNTNSTLKYLGLGHNQLITDKSIYTLIPMLQLNHTLEELNLNFCSLTEQGKWKLKNAVKGKKNFRLGVE